MRDEIALRWEPLNGVDAPCADFSFAYRAPHLLTVRMHYSRVVDNPSQDLELEFSGVVALKWEEEAIGLNRLSDDLPRCAGGRWVFPLLTIENSRWLAENQKHNPILLESRTHFVLTTMNDLGQIIARPNPKARWVQGDNSA